MFSEKPTFDAAQKTFLSRAARRYVWWETTNDALEYPQRVLAQVMNIGVWKDMCDLVEIFSPQELLDVLDNAEAGQFNERSWSFWHNRLTGNIPPMPKRTLA
jgi:hypothetical protein